MGQRGSRPEQLAVYDRLPELLPGAAFLFMNHGYAHLDGADEVLWLAEADRKYIYNVQLLLETLRSSELQNEDVLDVGCGRGGNCAILSRYFSPKRIVGVDLSAAGIRLCKRVLTVPNLTFVTANAMLLPFGSASFDIVLNIESSHCYPDRKTFYEEARRVLRPSGRLCYADCLPATDVAQVTTTLRRAGFDVRDVRDITLNVAESIRRRDHRHREMLLSAASTEEGAWAANAIADSVRGKVYENYRAGLAVYVIWHAQKQ